MCLFHVLWSTSAILNWFKIKITFVLKTWNLSHLLRHRKRFIISAKETKWNLRIYWCHLWVCLWVCLRTFYCLGVTQNTTSNHSTYAHFPFPLPCPMSFLSSIPFPPPLSFPSPPPFPPSFPLPVTHPFVQLGNLGPFYVVRLREACWYFAINWRPQTAFRLLFC